MNKLLLAAVVVFTLYYIFGRRSAETKYALTSQVELDAFLSRDTWGGVHVIMFHAKWCGYCQEAMPEALRVAADTERLMLVDGDHTFGRTLAKKYKITGFPTFVKFNHEGNKVDERGGRPKEGIVAFASPPAGTLG